MNGRDIRICTIFAFAKMEFMEKLHPIMFAGTGSDVGKSIIAAAFCRIFKQDGYQPAPFKAQNMALNSFATPEGLEIGRAQAVQAEAAGVPCHTDMNPLLLKPQSDHTSQVVLNGIIASGKAVVGSTNLPAQLVASFLAEILISIAVADRTPVEDNLRGMVRLWFQQ